MNMLDSRERFVRAEAATMRLVFPFVVLFSPRDSTNHVLVGSKVPVHPVRSSVGWRRWVTERYSSRRSAESLWIV
jgi:hypothetical protein